MDWKMIHEFIVYVIVVALIRGGKMSRGPPGRPVHPSKMAGWIEILVSPPA